MSLNPVPVMVKSSPPLVQPEVEERVTWRGLDWEMGLESSNIAG